MMFFLPCSITTDVTACNFAGSEWWVRVENFIFEIKFWEHEKRTRRGGGGEEMDSVVAYCFFSSISFPSLYFEINSCARLYLTFFVDL